MGGRVACGWQSSTLRTSSGSTFSSNSLSIGEGSLVISAFSLRRWVFSSFLRKASRRWKAGSSRCLGLPPLDSLLVRCETRGFVDATRMGLVMIGRDSRPNRDANEELEEDLEVGVLVGREDVRSGGGIERAEKSLIDATEGGTVGSLGGGGGGVG